MNACPLLFAAAALSVSAAPAASAQSPAVAPRQAPIQVPGDVPLLRGALIAGQQGYAVADPVPIAGPGVLYVLLSPDGRYIVAAGMTVRDGASAVVRGTLKEAVIEESVTVWDARTRQSRVVWRRVQPPSGRGMNGLRLSGWMGGTGRVVARLTLEEKSAEGEPVGVPGFLLIDPATGATRESREPGAAGGVSDASPSPTVPYAAILSPAGEGTAGGGPDEGLRFLRGDGGYTEPLRLPRSLYFSGWSADGNELIGIGFEDKATVYYAVRPADGALRRLPGPPPGANGPTGAPLASSPVAPPGLSLRLVGEPAEDGSPGGAVRLVGATSEESVRLTGEGQPVALLPDGSAALYRSGGHLYLCALRPVPIEAVRRFRRDRLRAETLADAGALGKALFRFHDANKALPAAGVDLATALAPYLNERTRRALARFTYAPPAGEISERTLLRDTIVGHLRASDGSGRAATRLLGRATWEDAAPGKD